MNPRTNVLAFVSLVAATGVSALAGCTTAEDGAADDSLALAEAAQHAERLPPVEEPLPPAPINRGLTWVKALHTNATGQDTVSCHDYTLLSPTPTFSCDPYVGDTDCREARRILCIRQDGSASNGFVGSFYNGWAAGNIGLTHPVVGASLTSLAVANAACVAEFGAGWRMAEHHDGGGGWQWTAYGNLNDIFTVNHPSHTLADRFWVHVNDQPGAPVVLDGGNCWD
jgi:hypothetical protein